MSRLRIRKNNEKTNEYVINPEAINIVINDREKNSIKEIENFCNQIDIKDIANIKTEELNKKLEDGTMLVDMYYESSINNSEMISRLQYVVESIRYEIMGRKTVERAKKIESTQKSYNSINKLFKNNKRELNNTKKEIKNINSAISTLLTTIISLVLTISVITGAIAGIERIDPDYILPFVSTIIFFGMTMILFVYSIYKEKIKNSTWIVWTSILVIVIVLWIMSFNKWMDISRDSKTVDIYSEQ